jgi:hypothetical protein
MVHYQSIPRALSLKSISQLSRSRHLSNRSVHAIRSQNMEAPHRRKLRVQHRSFEISRKQDSNRPRITGRFASREREGGQKAKVRLILDTDVDDDPARHGANFDNNATTPNRQRRKIKRRTHRSRILRDFRKDIYQLRLVLTHPETRRPRLI